MLSLANSLMSGGVVVPRQALFAAATCLPELVRSVSTTAAAEAQRRVTTPKRSADSALWKPAPARKMSAEAKELHDRQANVGQKAGRRHLAAERLVVGLPQPPAAWPSWRVLIRAKRHS